MIAREDVPLNAEISAALQVLEQLQETIQSSNNEKLRAQTKDDLNLLISTLQNPILRSIVTIQGSVEELDAQLQEHPSILPADFNITESGDLELNVQRSLYDGDFNSRSLSTEFDDQRVPVAKLSSSSGEASSPQVSTRSVPEISLPPITTQSYALEFQRVIEETSRGRDVFTVQLFKPEGTSLGFSVVGLRSEEKGELGIFIQEIQPHGIAGRDGKLHEGDQILAIDGQPLDSNISHQQAISILQQARGVVELVVARAVDHPATTGRSPSPSALSDTSKTGSDMVLSSDWAQVEVIDLINDGSGLGFGIVGGRSTGVVVKTILPGGVADRDGRLQSGDHILQIGDVNLRGMGSEQVAAVLRQSGSHVRIVVARPVESAIPDYQMLESQAPVVPSSIISDPDELNRYFIEHGYPEISASPPRINILEYGVFNGADGGLAVHAQDGTVLRDVVSPSLPLLTMDMIPRESFTQLPETEKFDVELKKDSHGIGITIAGYVCEKEELSGIFVKSINEGSAADVCGRIQVNDRIVEVDGKSLQGLTNHEAVETLRSTGQVVKLSLERYLRGPKFEQLQLAIANSELKTPVASSPSILSLPRFPILADEESTTMIEMEGASQTTIDSASILDATNNDIDLESLIDKDYKGTLKPTVEAAIQAKWTNIVGPDVDIVVAQLAKFSETGGLGISLEGTVDVEDGKEVRPHHYIRSILPEGPVGKNGRLRSGDELLEVNGHRLLGMNHIEVVGILKELPIHVRMVCARRAGELPPIPLIDTSQDRAAFAARNILGASFQSLIAPTDRLVKAKSDGSLASSSAASTESGLSKVKSRSLEPLTGFATWSSEPYVIELMKGERGLGFSILDYQDPVNPSETLIVIRSLVPGGVAQQDGRLIPGDRLLSVNDTNLEKATLDQAVQVLKGAPKGIVRITVAKPLPIPDSVSTTSQEDLRNTLQEGDESNSVDEPSMYSCVESLEGSPPLREKSEEHRESSFTPEEVALQRKGVVEEPCEEENVQESVDENDDEEEEHIDECIKQLPLPSALEREIKISKGCLSLGLVLANDADGINGVSVIELSQSGAFATDGRISKGDHLLSINNESLKRCTQSQIRSILKRTELLSTDITVRYIKGDDAAAYRQSLQKSRLTPLPPPVISSQVSPRSPYVDLYKSLSLSKVSSSADEKYPCSEPKLQDASDKKSQYKDPKSDISKNRFSRSLGDIPKIPSFGYRRNGSISAESARTVDIVDVYNDIPQTDLSESGSAHPSLSSFDFRKSEEVEKTPTESISDISAFVRCTVEGYKHVEYCLECGAQISDSESFSETDESSIVTSSDETLRRELKELNRLSKLHRLGSVDIEPYSFNRGSCRSEKSKTLHRFASTGVELGDDEDIMGIQEMVDSTHLEDSTCNLMAMYWGPERTVQLYRDEKKGLGITVVGGKIDIYNSTTEKRTAICGVFIKNAIPGTPAGLSNEFKTGDRILEVDGQDLRTVPHEKAVEIIKSAGDPVTFVVQSLVNWEVDRSEENERLFERKQSVNDVLEGRRSDTAELQKEEESEINAIITQQNRRSIRSAERRRQLFHDSTRRSSKTATVNADGDKSSSLDAVKEHENDDDNEISSSTKKNCTVTKAGRLIMRSSAGSIRQSQDEIQEDDEEEDEFGYTTYKVKKKYAKEKDEVLIVELQREDNGLGISLAGHKDRTKMAVMVCGLNPDGAAYKAGKIQVGDEILEVNGIVLQGRCHLNASAIIKGLAGPVFKIIICRRANALENLAVKPLTQFPVELVEETLEEKYANFKGLKIVTVKKGPYGLGIMVMVGTHAEVGQGIFISDIQEGSVAEQAGLLVGDMILSINKDTLVGVTSDVATSILKQAEGIVKIAVCNPKREIRAPSPAKAPPPPPEEPPVDPATAPIKPGKECTITINKDNLGLGLSIVGGSDTPLGTIMIREVYENGAAAKDGRLKPGDQILQINSENFRAIHHAKALSVLRQTQAQVTMIVYRDEAVANGEGANEENLLDIINVELTKKAGKGLGLSIVGRKNGNGVFISDVVPGSVAGSDSRLMRGDQVLAVNDHDLRNATQEEAAAVLKTTSGKVNIKLGRLKARPSPSASDNDSVTSDTPTYHTVVLRRGPTGFGFSVVGGYGGPHGDLPIYVKSVFHDNCKQVLRRGDQILSVNGLSLDKLTHQEAVTVLKNASDIINLTIQS